MDLSLISLLYTSVFLGLAIFLFMEPSEAEVRGAMAFFLVFALAMFFFQIVSMF